MARGTDVVERRREALGEVGVRKHELASKSSAGISSARAKRSASVRAPAWPVSMALL
jgi:hypothetical protein